MDTVCVSKINKPHGARGGAGARAACAVGGDVSMIDFDHIKPEHHAIHDRLENMGQWARKKVKQGGITMSPVWKLGKSNGRQWHAPEFTKAPDAKDAMIVQIAIRELPLNGRLAIGWYYCVQDVEPKRQARKMRITESDLCETMHSARQRLKIIL